MSLACSLNASLLRHFFLVPCGYRIVHTCPSSETGSKMFHSRWCSIKPVGRSKMQTRLIPMSTQTWIQILCKLQIIDMTNHQTTMQDQGTKDSVVEKKPSSDRLLHTMKETTESELLLQQKRTTIKHMVVEVGHMEIHRKQIDVNNMNLQGCNRYPILEAGTVKGYVHFY